MREAAEGCARSGIPWIGLWRDKVAETGLKVSSLELRRMREAVEDAGYEGPIEVEIFSEDLWALPGEEVLETMKRRCPKHVLDAAPAGGSA